MKCVKCGSVLNPNSPFCGICGEVIPPPQPVYQPMMTQQPMQQQPMMQQPMMYTQNIQPVSAPQSSKIFCGGCGSELPSEAQMCTRCGYIIDSPEIKKGLQIKRIKEIFIKHKIKILAGLIMIVLAIGGLFFYLSTIDHVKLNWDAGYGDYDNVYVLGGKVKLKANATDKDNVPVDVEYEVTGGGIKGDEEGAIWILPNEPGTYKVTAKAGKRQKVTKEITILADDFRSLLNADMIRPDGYKAENAPEYPTIPQMPRDEESTHTEAKGEMRISAVGTGDMWTTTIDLSTISTFKVASGTLPTLYDVHTSGRLVRATITIGYDPEELDVLGIKEENLAIYTFDVDTKLMERLPSTVNTENQTVRVQVTRFDRYILADHTKVDIDSETNVLFAIDNSVTMYSDEQLIDMGYTKFSGNKASDTDFLRIELSKQLIGLFSGNYNVSVGQFAAAYTVEQKFTNDKQLALKALEKLRTPYEGTQGTAIVRTLTAGIDSFEDSNTNNYIVLITDSKDNIGDISRSKASIIEAANTKNVKICVISLDDVDNELYEIARETGCKVYPASDADTFDEVHRKLGSTINFEQVDTNGDGKTDGTVVADSGFVVARDGFAFRNFSTILHQKGRSYGFATFAQAHFANTLPFSMTDIDNYGMYFEDTVSYRKEALGYTLRDSFFLDNRGNKRVNVLYDYKFATEGLQLQMFNPTDFRNNITNQEYMIKSAYYGLIEAIGASTRSVEYDGENKGIEKIQSTVINTASPAFRAETTPEEYNLILALDRLNVLQVSDKRISFLREPDKAYSRLESDLKKGIPVILSMNDDLAVNAVRIIRDNGDANKFKIEIYDSNYPGQTRYINVTRTKFYLDDVAPEVWNNRFKYDFQYDGAPVNLKIHMVEMD